MKKRFFNTFLLLLLIFPYVFLKIHGHGFFYRAVELAKVFRRKKSVKQFYHRSNSRCFSKNTEIFFSQRDDIAAQLISLINKEKKSIKIAAFVFTDNNIAKTLLHAIKRGVKVEIIVDKTFLKDHGATINYLKDHGANIIVYNSYGIMHHKIILLESQKKVGFGSYNFSISANKRNRENFTITTYKKVIMAMREEFERLKNVLTFS